MWLLLFFMKICDCDGCLWRVVIYIYALSLSFYHHLLFYQNLGFDRTDSIRFRAEGRLEIWNTFSAVVGKVNFSISEVALGTHRWFISQPHWVSLMIFCIFSFLISTKEIGSFNCSRFNIHSGQTWGACTIPAKIVAAFCQREAKNKKRGQIITITRTVKCSFESKCLFKIETQHSRPQTLWSFWPAAGIESSGNNHFGHAP